MSQKPFAFVLMPFSPDFDDAYKLGIQATAVAKGFVAERVDEQIYKETMLERIYRQIDAADLIIADLTGRNPNVFYEVGYAHAKHKMCILLTQDFADIPFDLKHHRHLVYGKSIKNLISKLEPELDYFKSEIERSKTSTFTIELKEANADLTKETWRASVSIDLKIDINNRSDRRSPEIEAIYLHTAKGWEYFQNGDKCPSTEVDPEKKTLRHFVRPPVSRLSPSGWAQISLKGSRIVWNKYLAKGEEPKDKYEMKGYIYLEVVTAEGAILQKLQVDTTAEEFPF